jgi:hypothetical protein
MMRFWHHPRHRHMAARRAVENVIIALGRPHPRLARGSQRRSVLRETAFAEAARSTVARTPASSSRTCCRTHLR